MAVAPFIKLNIEFDPEKLQKDLAKAEAAHKKTEVIGPYNDGSWSGIALRSNDGTTSDVEAFNQGACKDTEVLKDCVYFKEVLNNLGFTAGVARLLFLPAGKTIGSHRDKNSWKNGYVRLHLPVVTHPDVTMVIDGERQYMAPGELWFGDFSKVHSVENKSDINRVHLVIDSYVSEGLLNLLPKEAGQAIREEDVLVLPEERKDFKDNLEDFTGFYRASNSPIPVLGKVDAIDGRLHMEILGFPYSFSYYQMDDNKFQHMDNFLKAERDSDGNPHLYFNVKDGEENAIEIKLFESLSSIDKLQWGVQRAIVAFGFGVFYSYSFTMKYFHKLMRLGK